MRLPSRSVVLGQLRATAMSAVISCGGPKTEDPLLDEVVERTCAAMLACLCPAIDDACVDDLRPSVAAAFEEAHAAGLMVDDVCIRENL